MIKLRQIWVKNEGNQGIRSQAMLLPLLLLLCILYGSFLLHPGVRVSRPLASDSLAPLKLSTVFSAAQDLLLPSGCCTAFHVLLYPSCYLAPSLKARYYSRGGDTDCSTSRSQVLSQGCVLRHHPVTYLSGNRRKGWCRLYTHPDFRFLCPLSGPWMAVFSSV